MIPEIGKTYYINFLTRVYVEKCVKVTGTTYLFRDEFGSLWSRKEPEIVAEILTKTFPWLRLLALSGIIALAALSGYAIGRIHGSQSQPVAIEADK